MKFMIQIIFAALFSSGCSQKPQMTYVFPEADPLIQIWQTQDGELFSLRQREQGVFALHRPETGEFFYYERDKTGTLVSQPSHAPTLSYNNKRFTWGNVTLTEVPVYTEHIRFESDGVQFSGVLTVPNSDKPAPVIVNVLGSGRAAATQYDWSTSWYLQAGFASFVYDKRETGRTGGKPTHDFNQLARDVSAAIDAIENHKLLHPDAVGVADYSQGVYVSTLLASRDNRVDFPQTPVNTLNSE